MNDCFEFADDSHVRQLCLETTAVDYGIDSDFKAEESCSDFNRPCKDAEQVNTGIRKSSRVPKSKGLQHNEEDVSICKKIKKRQCQRLSLKKQKRSKPVAQKIEPNQKPFTCDLCKSPYVINPCRRNGKKIKQLASPRHLIDPESRQLLTLCNACGLSTSYTPKKQNKEMPTATEDKETYLASAKRSAEELAKEYGDEDADKLYCPHFKRKGCGCIQKFVSVAVVGDSDEIRRRVTMMLGLIKEARNLAQQKCYNCLEPQTTKARKHRAIGLGNGQKKSKMFEDFVLEHRRHLREEWKLCERATQRILSYSNNFLHKKLKTNPERDRRVERQKGKAALGLLVPIEDLHKRMCCGENCVSMAVTHSRLLITWRERASLGQAEARRVLAEMLTPSGGARCNCYKFVSMVTGCSNSTISSVSEQMRKTCGDREPPEHGLKKWWKDHPKARSTRDDSNSNLEDVSEQSGTSITSSIKTQDMEVSCKSQVDTAAQLQMYKMQNLELQKLVTHQQLLLQQRDQLLGQHLQPHHGTQAHHSIQQLFQPGTTFSLDGQSVSENSLQVAVPPLQIKVPASLTSSSGVGTSVLGHSSGLQQLLQNVIFDLPCTDAAGVTVNLNVAMADHAGNILTTSDFSNMAVTNVNIILPQQVPGESDMQNDTQTVYVHPVEENFVAAIEEASQDLPLDDAVDLHLPSTSSEVNECNPGVNFCQQLTRSSSDSQEAATALYNVQSTTAVISKR